MNSETNILLSLTFYLLHLLHVVELYRYLQEQLHFIDKRRLAVWGWSYGGFISTMLLSTSEQKLFHCGIAVSPVVSWKLYGIFIKII